MCSQTLRAGNLGDPPRRTAQTEEQGCRLLEDYRPVACDAVLSLAHTNVSEERTPSIFRVDEYHTHISRDLEPRLHFRTAVTMVRGAL